MEEKKKKFTYLMTDGRLFKIGESMNVERRLKQLKTANPFCELVDYGDAISEKYLHELLFQRRVKLEWFELDEKTVDRIKALLHLGEQGGKINESNSFTFNGILFKGTRKKGSTYYTKGDWEKKAIADGKRASDNLSSKYVINFGKYKGTKMKDMITDEQYDYCVWLYEEMKNKLGKGAKRNSRKYKAFSWRVRQREI